MVIGEQFSWRHLWVKPMPLVTGSVQVEVRMVANIPLREALSGIEAGIRREVRMRMATLPDPPDQFEDWLREAFFASLREERTR